MWIKIAELNLCILHENFANVALQNDQTVTVWCTSQMDKQEEGVQTPHAKGGSHIVMVYLYCACLSGSFLLYFGIAMGGGFITDKGAQFTSVGCILSKLRLKAPNLSKMFVFAFVVVVFFIIIIFFSFFGMY